MMPIVEDKPMLKPVDREFIQLEVYAVYKAISELFGEKGWDVIWRSGEIMFDEIEKRLEFADTDPLSVLKVLARYFVDAGYVEQLDFHMAEENVMEYELSGTLVRPAILKLKEENCVLPHWSTVVMFAALKKLCGVKAETDASQPEIRSATTTRERWVLSKIEP
jgi:hypothetical protein